MSVSHCRLCFFFIRFISCSFLGFTIHVFDSLLTLERWLKKAYSFNHVANVVLYIFFEHTHCEFYHIHKAFPFWHCSRQNKFQLLVIVYDDLKTKLESELPKHFIFHRRYCSANMGRGFHTKPSFPIDNFSCHLM